MSRPVYGPLSTAFTVSPISAHLISNLMLYMSSEITLRLMLPAFRGFAETLTELAVLLSAFTTSRACINCVSGLTFAGVMATEVLLLTANVGSIFEDVSTSRVSLIAGD